MKRRAAKQKLQQTLRMTKSWIRRKQASEAMRAARQAAATLLRSMSGATGTPSYQPAAGTPGDEIEDELAARISAVVAELKKLDIEHRAYVAMTGDEMRVLRIDAGLTQEELGQAIQSEQSHVSEMEHDIRPITRRTELAVRYVCQRSTE